MFRKLASFDNDINFPRLWRWGLSASAVALAFSIGALGMRGLNLGIDFEGGTSWEIEASGVTVPETRDALAGTTAAAGKIQVIGGDTLRIQAAPSTDDAVSQVTEALADLTNQDTRAVAVSTVGPTWGDEVTSKALRALVYFFVIVAAYMAIRLEWKMAVGALVAVVHDIGITVGVYAIFQFEVTPATVISILTILGYSLYDTIVVFDKAQENTKSPASTRMTYTDLMSLSLNQVLMRSLNTSITSLLPVLAMLVVGSLMLGAVTLQEFSIALAVGITVGAYSSIFIATPIVAALKEREPRYVAIRERLAAIPAATSTEIDPPSDTRSAGTRPIKEAAPTLSGRTIPPRPRKQKRRR